ncbi:MAG: 1-(5-phosphoribosyl)-5-[(5-phosphoribosylamino)methylideneamino]imidazole-4-carboxamide isomerase [Lachnospiraceae bacterium]|nr:1-(5-phosphoribosyl)-5-[(5-phosphoribosylamino)methylideneamino]imidazole-4-carboxamide isomerase [Lachnospiraceae bacterium]
MILLPAIDLKDGKCVRLRKGNFDEKTVYSDKPWEIAKEFENAGAQMIHLVDLDGALAGHSVNADVIKKITSSVNIPCELGGGIRNKDSIEAAVNLGISRVILGTIAVSDPEFVTEAVETFGPEKTVVGIDAKDGMVAIHGWDTVSNVTSVDLALDMKRRGVRTVIYTDISRDGMLSGPNVEQTLNLKNKTGMTVIASGGVSCLDDLIRLNDSGIDGSIIGKAIYENKIDLREAVRRLN